ncbi:hypothetical protein SAMN05428971_0628 [Candidatus Pantoea varia]|uniref:Uncharacterized protein n=1 Tax=Candidatus Pantoea varia TaxID=1881036 RepID=A0A1I4XCP2_9GAMM|nr:hypothetical protein SAMN05428971_0628 [Pantoea varia]
MMIGGREICKVFPVQINHGYKLFNPVTADSASLPHPL